MILYHHDLHNINQCMEYMQMIDNKNKYLLFYKFICIKL